MCLTMPARVLGVTDGWAQLDVGGRTRRASTLAVPEVRPGDWALVSAGNVVRVLEPDLAQEIIAALHVASDRRTDGGDFS